MLKLSITDPVIQQFQDMLAKASGQGDDIYGRNIVVTPIVANYGRPAFWFATVNGSPPKGTVLIRKDRHISESCTVLKNDGKGHRLGEQHATIAQAFLDAVLAAASIEPDSLEAEPIEVQVPPIPGR